MNPEPGWRAPFGRFHDDAAFSTVAARAVC